MKEKQGKITASWCKKKRGESVAPPHPFSRIFTFPIVPRAVYEPLLNINAFNLMANAVRQRIKVNKPGNNGSAVVTNLNKLGSIS